MAKRLGCEPESLDSAAAELERERARLEAIEQRLQDLEQVRTVAEAQAADIERAVAAARKAFDSGPWPRLSHAERAEWLRKIAREMDARAVDTARIWSVESGMVHSFAAGSATMIGGAYDYYAGLADSFEFIEHHEPRGGGNVGLLVREPVGVVGAIIPWNGTPMLVAYKVAPALLDREEWKAEARRGFEAYAGRLAEYPAAMPQMLVAMDSALDPPRHVVIAASAEGLAAPETRALVLAFRKRFRPRDFLVVVEAGEQQARLARLLPWLEPLGLAHTARDLCWQVAIDAVLVLAPAPDAAVERERASRGGCRGDRRLVIRARLPGRARNRACRRAAGTPSA